jgi:hypothetical protein
MVVMLVVAMVALMLVVVMVALLRADVVLVW